MKQKGASCSICITEFNHYALLSCFDKLMLRELFYNVLKVDVKDLLLTFPEETTLYISTKSKQPSVTFVYSNAAKRINGTPHQIVASPQSHQLPSAHSREMTQLKLASPTSLTSPKRSLEQH
jgi:hypothetical protein